MPHGVMVQVAAPLLLEPLHVREVQVPFRPWLAAIAAPLAFVWKARGPSPGVSGTTNPDKFKSWL